MPSLTYRTLNPTRRSILAILWQGLLAEGFVIRV